MNGSNEQLNQVLQKRENYRHRAFLMMLEVAFILAIPAFVAVFFGLNLDASQGTGRRYTLIFLVLAFIISWAVIIRKYIIFTREIKKVNGQVKKLEENQKS